MLKKSDQSGEAGPMKNTIEYQDSKGQTKRKTLEYGGGGDRQPFYDAMDPIAKDMEGSKKKEE
jgi:hypothetical protein